MLWFNLHMLVFGILRGSHNLSYTTHPYNPSSNAASFSEPSLIVSPHPLPLGKDILPQHTNPALTLFALRIFNKVLVLDSYHSSLFLLRFSTQNLYDRLTEWQIAYSKGSLKKAEPDVGLGLRSQ